MLKRVLISAIIAALSAPTVWLFAGFIAYDLNPGNWGYAGRYMSAVITLFSGIGLFVFSMAAIEKD